MTLPPRLAAAVLGCAVTLTTPAGAQTQSLSTSLNMVVFPAKAQAEADAEAASQRQANEQQAAQQEKLDLFKKGFSACLESKGYTVK